MFMTTHEAAVSNAKGISIPPRLLYGPGPTTIDPRVMEAMSQPALGIRDPVFLQIAGEIQSGLRTVFGTANARTFVVPGSGSAAMETAVSNFVEPGMKFAVFANGHFANRMIEMGQRQRANIVRLDKPWGAVFGALEASEFLDRERPDVVGFVQGETSTGAYQSGIAISETAHRIGALVIGDCVTSLGAMPVQLDANGIDIAYSCGQKGLSCPAGLSPVSINERAWERLNSRKEPTWSWYLDARMQWNYFDTGHVYHHTPAASLYYAMHRALSLVDEEGLNARWERHRRAGQQLVAGLEKLGFISVVENPEQRLWHLSTVTPPTGVNEAKLRERLLEKYDIEVAGGLGQFAGKILRIGAMGPLATEERVAHLLACLAAAL
jgi:alanine-glyoxylate transaminase / serine-glyoxylate transaminase / serine-pyruvate transaminase